MLNECNKFILNSDICYKCKKMSITPHSQSRWSGKILIILLIITKEISCNIPAKEANSISDGRSHLRSSIISSSEGDESYENDDSVASVVNDEVLAHYAMQNRNYSRTTPGSANTPYATQQTTTIPPPACSGSCFDKQARENAALDSLKKQLLTRLGMERTPNITKSQKIPENFLEEFCKRANLPPEYCLGSTMSDKNYEYQSDGPSAFEEFDLDVIEEEEDVQYMSAESRIYAFPNCKFKENKFTMRSGVGSLIIFFKSLNIFED